MKSLQSNLVRMATLVVLVFLFRSLPVLAQAHPCQDDLKRLCPNAKPGTGEARKCLMDNQDKLSEACHKRIDEARGRQKGYPARFRGCEADLDKFCKDTTPGAGRLVKCLREHENELSPECKNRIPSGRGGGGGGGGRGHGGGSGTTPAEKSAESTPKAN